MVTKLRNNKLLCILWLLLCCSIFSAAVRQYTRDSLDGYFIRHIYDPDGRYALAPATTAAFETEDASLSFTFAEADEPAISVISPSGFTGYTGSLAFLICAGLLACLTGGCFFCCFHPRRCQELLLFMFLVGFLQLLGDSLTVLCYQRFGRLPWLLNTISVISGFCCASGALTFLWSWNSLGLHGSWLGEWFFRHLHSKSLPRQLLIIILTALSFAGLLTVAVGRLLHTYFPAFSGNTFLLLLPAFFALAAYTGILLFFLAGPHSAAADMDALVQESVRTTIAQEKLKVDLITNISHDLKTPLTSIIGYGEQLERLALPPDACEILEKLQHKSSYLLDMVEEVFELSKASSGHLPMKKEIIDLGRLLEQTLGGLDDELTQSGFLLKKDFPQTGMMVCCDGLHMHRVFQNLLDNAIKYACPQTRIFIHACKRTDGFCEVRIRNTSSYPMDFDPEEITERFVRGEKARTGEGSGLGLAIAKTYTESCGGQFRILTEDDIFTAVVCLPSA